MLNKPVPVTRAAAEQQKIDTLLSVFDTPGIIFRHKGRNYAGKEAKKLLVKKMDTNNLGTAEEFVAHREQRDKEKGSDILVFKDGTTADYGTWLRKKLKEIEQKQ